jgi:hypothetical protein
MNNCIHCNSNNSESWFYCRSCGKRASENKYSQNLWMRTERGKRTDVEFSTQTIDESINEMNKKKES